jgi:adenylate cyclase
MESLRKESQVAPLGKVTIVFTDVHNSTELWEKFPKAMTQALRLHNALFRGQIDKYTGYEVKTEGDAFMVAFSEAKDAILFALSIQEALMDIEWPEEIVNSPYAAEERDQETGFLLYRGLKVRVGMHCGVPLCQNDPITGRMDYFGQMVNKSARISAATSPGQILVSKTVFKELEEYKHIMSNMTVTPLGTIRLKGINTDVEVSSCLEIK